MLHLARDGSEVPISSQFGGVLRTKNQLYFGEKEDVNKNISGRIFFGDGWGIKRIFYKSENVKAI